MIGHNKGIAVAVSVPMTIDKWGKIFEINP
jgi:hypothetical protein